jgi:hypothetical protein
MHLMHPAHDVEPAGQGSADEIEVTPEMVDAGLEAYIDLLFNENGHERIVTEVFSAMMRARVKSRSQTPAPAQ